MATLSALKFETVDGAKNALGTVEELAKQQIIDLALDKSAIKDRPLEGYIGFQDEAKRVWYRNVRIKELKPAA